MKTSAVKECRLVGLVVVLFLLGFTGRAEWERHVIKPPGKSKVSCVIPVDFNKDGLIDVISSYDNGVFILLAPKWEPVRIYTFVPGKSKRRPLPECLHACLMDVDQDGDLDFCGSNLTLFWLECPDDPLSGAEWTYRTIDDEVLATHCLVAQDFDGDGKQELFANSWYNESKTPVPESLVWYDVPEKGKRNQPWPRTVFADRNAKGGSHYFEFGDLNGDGRLDLCCAAKGGGGYPGGEWFAWWEQPENPRTDPWVKHVLSSKEPGATNIIPVDLNGDKQLDLVASRGHDRGIVTFMGPEFTRAEIGGLRGPHSLVAVDLDNDGDVDVAACSREISVGARWYENDGTGKFVPHLIGKKQAAYDLRSADVDGDGDTDLVVAGQDSRNIVWFENPLPSQDQGN